ncbi:uncharacterized protein KD926_002764 [Aspergillus affinis]|uniref:uncharacterized protein n=1 Tax=Aspergillus affinis TaxID=1070780 RepID=UPI0022FE17BC|nr:uncharacterized protein KD926_002764 [Aspergillus affinis]KAI9043873.1 hypothetical protein KD926_002764 [Aspergillus affinis]
MHFLAFLTVALMTVFATVMALPREPDAKLAQSAADEYDQSRGFVNSIEPSLSASPEGSEYVAGDIEFDEDHPARKLIPRGGECSYGHRFCGVSSSTKYPAERLHGRKTDAHIQSPTGMQWNKLQNGVCQLAL